MAANLDRAETSLTAVSDVAYIRAIDSSGNSVRISKADLASVLGVGVLRKRNPNVTSDNIDTLLEEGLYVNSTTINLNNKDCGYGVLWVFKNANTIQIFFGTIIMYRTMYAGVSTWNAWKQLQFVS